MSAPLMVKSHSGRYVRATAEDIRAAHAELVLSAPIGGSLLESPRAVREALMAAYGSHPHELFGMVLLDNRHRLLRFRELFRGTIDGASVHPREVVKLALEDNAAAAILYHNHPSGVAEPSQADELITLRLKDALSLVDIRVLDHLIVTRDRSVSLAERGVL